MVLLAALVLAAPVPAALVRTISALCIGVGRQTSQRLITGPTTVGDPTSGRARPRVRCTCLGVGSPTGPVEGLRPTCRVRLRVALAACRWSGLPRPFPGRAGCLPLVRPAGRFAAAPGWSPAVESRRCRDPLTGSRSLPASWSGLPVRSRRRAGSPASRRPAGTPGRARRLVVARRSAVALVALRATSRPAGASPGRARLPSGRRRVRPAPCRRRLRPRVALGCPRRVVRRPARRSASGRAWRGLAAGPALPKPLRVALAARLGQPAGSRSFRSLGDHVLRADAKT